MQTSLAQPEPAAETSYLLTVNSDTQSLRFRIPAAASVRNALDATELRVRAACGGIGTCGACLIQILSGEFNPPTLNERLKIPAEDLDKGMRLACQLRLRSDAELYLQYPAPHSEWKSLNSSGLYAPERGNDGVASRIYGVAVDLGTTQIRLSLWNRQTGRRIGSRYSLNPQAAHGADILTRLDAERQGEHLYRILTELARKAIIDGIRDILIRDVGEVSPMLEEIGKVLIVGNTAMLTIICGNSNQALFQPENWQQAIDCQPADTDAWRKEWRTPHADISICQPLAGFIGSDLLADLVATEFSNQVRPQLLADFGTNTEIALWDGQTIWISSVPGGPAFEGMGLRNGLAAEPGAICKVEKHNGELRYQTIAGAAPRGFCACGIVDAIALLVEDKIIKPSGRFAQAQPDNAFRLDPALACTALYPTDIDMFQRAKASTAAAIAQLLTFAGLSVNDLAQLWICGSFGRHLDLDKSMRIGLLPTLDSGRIRLLDNASLAGCEKLLLDKDSQSIISKLSGQIRATNLSHISEYELRFIDNLRLTPMPA